MIIYHSKMAILPGKTLASLLKKENMTKKELAHKTGLSEKSFSNIILGKTPITNDVAVKLESVFGGKSSFWDNLQEDYNRIMKK